MKTLLKIVLVLVLLVGAVLTGGLVYIDSIARAGVEKGATYALGVETTLDKADVKVMAGEFSMAGLKVANPGGFEGDHFLSLRDGGVSVSLASLRSDVVELPVLKLSGIDVVLDRREGKANYQVILDNLKRFESGDKPAKPASEGKGYVIREIDIRDITVHTSLLAIGGKPMKLDVPIESIRLENVGSGAGGAVSMGELAGVLIKAIFAAVMQSGQLPAELLEGLRGQLAQLEPLADHVKKIEALGQGLDEEIGRIGKEVEGAKAELEKNAKEIGGAIEDAAKGIGDLLGGDRNKKKN